MDNIYFEVAFLLFKNVLLNDSNYDMIGHICTVAIVVLFFMCIFIAGYAIFFPLLNNKKYTKKDLVLASLAIIMAITGIPLSSYRKEHNMEQALIQSTEAIHMLATKHNMNNEVVWGIAQDIVFCEPNSLKYTSNSSIKIQCENKNYYGQKVNYNKVKENLNHIQKHNPESFIITINK